MNNDDKSLLEALSHENMESLTKRGRGSELNRYLLLIGASK